MNRFVLFVSMLCLSMALKAQNTIENPFFEKVKFRGAFGEENWTKGWANWEPQTTAYPAANIDVMAGDITANTTWGPNNTTVFGKQSFAATPLQNAFFETTNYIGAFGSNDWTKGWANWDPQNTTYFDATEAIPVNANNEIEANFTMKRGKVYLLQNWVYVKDGVTLTIEPGVVIRGDKATKGALIIEKGARIVAQGTELEPIVFTSNQPVGQRSYGDWGGLVICGKATVNKVDPVIEGGLRSTYGGTDDADNSGVLKYVRIEFPGIAFQPDKEINGLTFGAVGTGTLIDYVQVSYSGDDSYEWFGGTVNAKHLIAFRGWDDDFDTDYGYRGMVQFAVALRDPVVADPGSGSNGFESDNDGTGTASTPITNPIFSNVSMFGPLATPSTTINVNYKNALHLRRNTKLSIYNSLISGFAGGVLIEGASVTNAKDESLQIKNTYIAGITTFFNTKSTEWTQAEEEAWFRTAEFNNKTFSSVDELMINEPFLLTSPNFLPQKSVYQLNGWVYVTNGATLTIEAGTVIRGDKSSKAALVIEKGAKLMAEGTKDLPIVFTSNQPVGQRSYGDWGGLVICGKATVNKVDPVIEGGLRSTYGGSDDADNSGVLKYVRIEFPGIAFQPDKEINGLTLGAVGNSTVVDYVQVSYSGDDSYEWFGGTVNAKHIIAYRGWDDDFDTDYGYRGMVQFGVTLRDPVVADPGSGSNGFESDNDGSGTPTTPITQPIFSNISVFGPLSTPATTINANYLRGMHLRRNTQLNLYNSILTGYVDGFYIEGPSVANAKDNSLKISHTTLAGFTNNFKVKTGEWTLEEVSTWFTEASKRNQTLVAATDLKIKEPFNLNAPDFLPTSDSPVLNSSYWMVNSISINSADNSTSISTDGGSLQLTAVVLPANAIDKSVTWSVEAGDIPVSISQTGLVTASGAANGNGTIRIIATANDGSAVNAIFTINISGQVGDPVHVSSIIIQGLNGVTVINQPNGTLQLSAIVLPENADVKTVTWSIESGNDIASINQQGLVQAVGTKNGTVMVKAVSTDGSNKEALLQITVSNQPTAISDVVNIGKMNVFPNPFTSETSLYYELDEPQQLQILVYDALGKLMSQTETHSQQGEVKIDTKNSKGLFIIKVLSKNNSQIFRIIAQ